MYRRSMATTPPPLKKKEENDLSDQGRGRRSGNFKPAEEETFRNGVHTIRLFGSLLAQECRTDLM
jgi:hypothetical protein